MFTVSEYVKVSSIDEAYKLNEKKTAVVLGGCGWLKMGKRAISTAIDLSGLGLDKIEENENAFEIGCMTTLRDIEVNTALKEYFGECITECFRHIVGVQFRNCATIGGSIWGRFGFSDPLTLFLALDAKVRLHKAGEVMLSEFVNMKPDRDILTHVILPKRGQKAVYLTHRAAETDFPVIACAVCKIDGEPMRLSVGARPQRAALILDNDNILSGGISEENAKKFADHAANTFNYSSNMRGSAQFRKHLTRVLACRALMKLEG